MIKYFRRTCAAFLVLTVIVNPISLVKAQNLELKLDSLLINVFKDKNGPGAAFMVAKNGRPIYTKAFGKANVELDIDLTPAYVFQLGSITKQFTAIAMLMLEEQGKLNVDDNISKYIPDFPSGDKITIHHLLTHTSGIKDFTRMKALREIAQKDLSPKEMVDFFKVEPADFLPGEKFEYNNSGYVILGYIIELVSEETYENYIKGHIFEKVGMSNSRYASDIAVISKRAYGYNKKDTVYTNKSKISFSIPFSSGSLMSTVDDMLKWQNALNKNMLLGKIATKKAFTDHKLNNGKGINYGYGWHLKEINGIETREHGGSIFGFKTMGVHMPKNDIYIIALTNCDCNSPTQVTRDVAKVVLEMSEKP